MMQKARRLWRVGLAAILVCLAIQAATPEQYRQKVGIYAWGQLRKTGDPLPAAVSDLKALGAKVFRTAIGPYWDPRGIEDLRPLDEKMKRDDYQAALRAFPVVMLTAYDKASYYARYRTPVTTPAQRQEWEKTLKAVRDEFQRFAYELSKIPDVTYIVSNWEAENDATDEVWPQYLEYVQARLQGTLDGRDLAWAEGYPAQVYTAFEFRYLKPGAKDQWTNTPARKFAGLQAALRDLTGVEFLSYSSWSSISHSEPFGYNERQLHAAFADMRSGCENAAHPCRIIIGETGYLWDHDPDQRQIRAILDTCLNERAEYILNWCAYDQTGQTDPYGFKSDQSHWGKYTGAGELTPQGREMRVLYSVPLPRPAPSTVGAGAHTR
jgi:hypothetical protein